MLNVAIKLIISTVLFRQDHSNVDYVQEEEEEEVEEEEYFVRK